MRHPLISTFAVALAVALGPAACKRAGAQDATPPNPSSASVAVAHARGDAFLAKNAKEAGVVVLPSGLQYKVVRSGPAGGPHPREGDEIRVHYEGTLLDGTVFDSTLAGGQPAVMALAHLVPGWMEALPLMRPGDEWILYVPPALGYGDQDGGGPIPPGSVLVFRLQLLGVLPQSAHAMG